MDVRIALFGTFWPEYNFAGNSTTPIAVIFASGLENVVVDVFCQAGASMPPGVGNQNLRLIPCWRHNDPVSLLKALFELRSLRASFDAVLFNTYVTSYGRSRLANFVGLMLPGLASTLTGRPVFVYMHNLVETQDIEKLGYRTTWSTRALVKVLEWSLLRFTTVIVPLRSQSQVISANFSERPSVIFLPYLEGYLPAKRALTRQPRAMRRADQSPRILLLGTWGPQKDLDGTLSVLDNLAAEPVAFTVVLAGGPNLHFPDFLKSLDLGRFPHLRDRLTATGPISEDSLFQEVLESQILILPYRAMGGYSGSLNFAGITGIKVIAFDHEQLREQSGLLRQPLIFTESTRLLSTLRSELSRLETSPGLGSLMSERADQVERGVGRLLERIVQDVSRRRLANESKG